MLGRSGTELSFIVMGPGTNQATSYNGLAVAYESHHGFVILQFCFQILIKLIIKFKFLQKPEHSSLQKLCS